MKKNKLTATIKPENIIGTVILILWFYTISVLAVNFKEEKQSNNNDVCSTTNAIQQCPFPIKKYPITSIVNVVHAGISKQACIDKMANFNWPVGVYCPKSEFCGFGINTNRDYRDDFPNVVEPTRELCEVLINSKMTDCDSLEIMLDEANIIQS